MSICPESEFRESLSDGEFWEYVMTGKIDGPDDYEEVDPPEVTPCDEWGVCPTCFSTGPCGYDAEGEPMRHVTKNEGD